MSYLDKFNHPVLSDNGRVWLEDSYECYKCGIGRERHLPYDKGWMSQDDELMEIRLWICPRCSGKARKENK